MRKPIKVLVVDDSELIRTLLTEILNTDPNIEVIGTASDPFDAREKIKQLNPDVLTLDIEMPRMDGITFLGNLMRLRPTPVVMISTLTEKGTDSTMQALELGAIDYVAKPKLGVSSELPKLSKEIIAKVKLASRANISALEHNIKQEQFSKPISIRPNQKLADNIKIIAIGASTGGTEAIKEVLTSLPVNMPPIVIAQHMPAGFTKSFAKRLDKLLPFTVEEFIEGKRPLKNNHVYIANGNEHLIVRKRGDQLFGACEDSEPVNRHKPSVDRLFISITESCTNDAIALLLTGMGIDGANGMAEIRKQGSITIAQDEKSSVVWGMPKAAVERNAATEVLALKKIGRRLTELCYN